MRSLLDYGIATVHTLCASHCRARMSPTRGDRCFLNEHSVCSAKRTSKPINGVSFCADVDAIEKSLDDKTPLSVVLRAGASCCCAALTPGATAVTSCIERFGRRDLLPAIRKNGATAATASCLHIVRSMWISCPTVRFLPCTSNTCNVAESGCFTRSLIAYRVAA